MIRIAVLGAGRIGRIHGRNAASHPDARLVAVADPHAPSAQELAAATGAEVAVLEEIVERSDVDAILVCTPTTTHADLIERGARAGKAVFCEKPVDLSSARIEACLATVEKAGTPLMIGFNRRFDPNFACLRAAARRRRGRRGRNRHHPVARSRPAAGELHRHLGRPVPGHDDPRSRHGALPAARRRAGGGASRSARPSSIRRSAQAGDVDTAAVLLKTASGQDRADLQFAPRHLRLRPAHRGARLEGHDPRRQHPPHHGRGGQRLRHRAPTRCRISSWSATRRPIATSWPRSSTRFATASRAIPPAMTA